MIDDLAASPAHAAARQRPFVLAWCAGHARAAALMWREAACRLLGRPPPSEDFARTLGAGRRFALQRGPVAAVLLPMIVLSSCVDVPLCHGAVHVLAAPAHRLPLHLLTLAANAWTLAWALALRSAMRPVDHVLGTDRLTLAIGQTRVARIPLAAIGEVHLLGQRQPDPLAARGLARGAVTDLAGLERPNLLIGLRPAAAGASLSVAGVPRRLRAWVAVYADQPRELHAALAAAIAPVQGNA